MRDRRSFSAVANGDNSYGRSPSGIGSSDACAWRFHCSASASSGPTVRRTAIQIAEQVTTSIRPSGISSHSTTRLERWRLSMVSATSTTTCSQPAHAAPTAATRTCAPS